MSSIANGRLVAMVTLQPMERQCMECSNCVFQIDGSSELLKIGFALGSVEAVLL